MGKENGSEKKKKNCLCAHCVHPRIDKMAKFFSCSNSVHKALFAFSFRGKPFRSRRTSPLQKSNSSLWFLCSLPLFFRYEFPIIFCIHKLHVAKKLNARDKMRREQQEKIYQKRLNRIYRRHNPAKQKVMFEIRIKHTITTSFSATKIRRALSLSIFPLIRGFTKFYLPLLE